MPDAEFDCTELDEFTKDLLRTAEETIPRETDKFLKREGNKLRTRTKAEARGTIKTKTGNYLSGIKRGKVYTYEGARSIRVYAGRAAPHAHLVDKGHRVVVSNTIGNWNRKFHAGYDTGFYAKGKHIYDNAAEKFESKYYGDAEKFIDDVLDRGLL